MQIESLDNLKVGEKIPLRWSYLSRLLDNTGQTLSTPVWTSQTPARAAPVVGSAAMFTSPDAAAQGIANDAALGVIELLAAGVVYITVTVTGANPATTYIGVFQLNIEAIPT